MSRTLQVSVLLASGLTADATNMICPGSGAWFGHAKTMVTATANVECFRVRNEVHARSDGQNKWVDPHNGGIYTVGWYAPTPEAGQIYTLRTTNPKTSVGGKVYTDKQLFVFTPTADKKGCTIEACSESQSSSIKDFSTNYCDIRNLFCGSADGCTVVLEDFTSTETKVDASSGQHDPKACIVKPKLAEAVQAVVVTERDIPGMIEKFICKYATEKDIEDKAVDEICGKVCTGKLAVFTPVCQKFLAKDWDQVMKSCPKPAVVV